MENASSLCLLTASSPDSCLFSGYHQWGSKCVLCDGTRWDVLVVLFVLSGIFVLFFHRVSQGTSGATKVRRRCNSWSCCKPDVWQIFMFQVQMAVLFIGNQNVWVAPLEIFNFDFLKTSGSSTCIAPISQLARMGLGNVQQPPILNLLLSSGLVVPVLSYFHLGVLALLHRVFQPMPCCAGCLRRICPAPAIDSAITRDPKAFDRAPYIRTTIG